MSTEGRIRLLPEAIAWDGVVRNSGRQRLLFGFLRAHPQRLADVRRLVPEAVRGLRAHGSVRGGRLLVERLSVEGHDDLLLEMVLWHAVFPGLQAPLVAWWVDGPYCLSTAPPDLFVTLDDGMEERLPEKDRMDRYVQFHRGHIVSAPALGEGIGAPFEWPLPARLVIAPLVLLLTPIAIAAVYRDAFRGKDTAVPWWTFLLTPLFMVVVLMRLIVPGPFIRHIEPVLERIGERARWREAVNGLVSEALRQDLPRSLSK
jgi:hypothetical protein